MITNKTDKITTMDLENIEFMMTAKGYEPRITFGFQLGHDTSIGFQSSNAESYSKMWYKPSGPEGDTHYVLLKDFNISTTAYCVSQDDGLQVYSTLTTATGTTTLTT